MSLKENTKLYKLKCTHAILVLIKRVESLSCKHCLPVLKNSEITQKQQCPVHTQTRQADGVMNRCFASSGDQTDTIMAPPHVGKI